jgi:hypothetical protein
MLTLIILCVVCSLGYSHSNIGNWGKIRLLLKKPAIQNCLQILSFVTKGAVPAQWSRIAIRTGALSAHQVSLFVYICIWPVICMLPII